MQVFDLLLDVELGEQSTAFAALNLSDHEYKKWGEVDFVILSAEGLVVVEVKGGLVSCDARGIWRYESRGRRPVERTESPIAQASSAYFSLRKSHLWPAIGRERFGHAPSGFCTILAHTPRNIARGLTGGTEMPPELVGTSEDIRDPQRLTSFLAQVLDYWREHPPGAAGSWSATEVNSLGKALRPCFDRVAPLSLSAARIRQEQLVLTEDQYRVLDFADRAERLLCVGGAGCGKTLMAAECMKREMPNDPLLVTGTPALAAHLRVSLRDHGERITSFQELGSRPPHHHGCLIVDEGQQITNFHDVEVLSQLLTGGIEKGRWRWFSDPNNQLLESSRFDQRCHAWLSEISFPGSLHQNCRNTPQIMSAVQVLTGADVGLGRLAGRGPDVSFSTGATPTERLSCAANIIRDWLKDPEIHPGEIVILSPKPYSQSSARVIADLARIPIRAWEPGWDSHATYPSRLGAATIEQFRGLEAPFVVICDLDECGDELKNFIYLGLTRANFALVVAAEPSAIAALATAAARTKIQTKAS